MDNCTRREGLQFFHREVPVTEKEAKLLPD
jgi:hypothetical protein